MHGPVCLGRAEREHYGDHRRLVAVDRDRLRLRAGLPRPRKQANGAALVNELDYAEITGVTDSEDVVVVPKATAGLVWTAAGDTDLDVTYDAVGATTEPTSGDPLSVKTFQLILEKLDPLDPSTVLKSMTLNHCCLVAGSYGEGDEADKISFQVLSFSKRPVFTDGAVS